MWHKITIRGVQNPFSTVLLLHEYRLPEKEFPFTEHEGKLPCSEKHLGIPFINQTHSIQISHLILLKWTFPSYHYGAAVSTMTRIYAGLSGVQNLARARDQSLFRNIHISSSIHSDSNSSHFSGSKVARADSLTTNIRLELHLKINETITPLNASASMTQWDFILP